MRNAHVRLVVRVYFTLCHSHLTALLFRSLLSFFSARSLSRPLCVSFRSFQWNWYSIHLIFIYIDIDLILSYGRFDSIRLFFVSTSRPSWCCSIVIRSLGFSVAPDFIQIERSKRIKTLHSIAFLSAFTTVFFSLSMIIVRFEIQVTPNDGDIFVFLSLSFSSDGN